MKRRFVVFIALVLAVMMVGSACAETRTVTGGWLRLRTAPSYSAATITSYPTGTQVTVLGESNGWCNVRTSDGRVGYMVSRYLSAQNTGTGGGGTGSGGSGVVGTATVVSPNGLGVRLRSGPSTAYGILRVCPVGTVVQILSSGTNWSYVRVGGINGYMMSIYLASGGGITPTPPVGPGYTAFVISANGLGVRLRSGPGLNYGILGVYSVGTRVTVLNHGAVWDYIRIGTRTGYMMNTYLTTSGGITPPSTAITAVYLSSDNPAVGDTLYATVIPAGATASYTWVNAYDQILGYGQTLYVDNSMLGMRVRVRVTGTGIYTGSAISRLTQEIGAWGSMSGGSGGSGGIDIYITEATGSDMP